MTREDILYSAEIRVNTEIFSSVADTRDVIDKTIFLENDHNQDLKCLVQASRDSAFTNPINVTTENTVIKNTGGVTLLTDYYPYIRVRIKYDVAPTTGTLQIYLHKKVS